MSLVKCKIEVHVEIDTDNYPVPSDGRFTLSLGEDVKETLESNLALEVNNIKVVKTSGKLYDEVRNTDFE